MQARAPWTCDLKSIPCPCLYDRKKHLNVKESAASVVCHEEHCWLDCMLLSPLSSSLHCPQVLRDIGPRASCSEGEGLLARKLQGLFAKYTDEAGDRLSRPRVLPP
jgi:hypothetical protein